MKEKIEKLGYVSADENWQIVRDLFTELFKVKKEDKKKKK